MTAQFTPGPWHHNTPTGRRVFMPNDTVEIRADSGGLVACLYAENFPHGQDEANAMLIKAAPELYEALDAIISKLPYPDSYHPSVGAPLCNQARAVLAKARGDA